MTQTRRTAQRGEIVPMASGSREIELEPIDGNPRQLRVVRPEIVEPEQWEPVQLPARATRPAITAHVEGSYTDRARGFSLSTWQLSTVTALTVATVAAVVGGASLSFLAIVAWALGGYFAVWLISYAMHVFVSPEGTELFRAAGEYRLLREEQKERHRRYREMRGE